MCQIFSSILTCENKVKNTPFFSVGFGLRSKDIVFTFCFGFDLHKLIFFFSDLHKLKILFIFSVGFDLYQQQKSFRFFCWIGPAQKGNSFTFLWIWPAQTGHLFYFLLWDMTSMGWRGSSIDREHPTRDPKTRGSNPIGSTRKIWGNLSKSNMLCWLVSVPNPRVCTNKNDHVHTLKIL